MSDNSRIRDTWSIRDTIILREFKFCTFYFTMPYLKVKKEITGENRNGTFFVHAIISLRKLLTLDSIGRGEIG